MLHPPRRGRDTKAKEYTRLDTEAERGAGGRGAKTEPQLHGAVGGAIEERRAETCKAYREADGSDRRGAGKDSAGGQSDPSTAGEYVAQAERAGTN